MIAIVVVGSLAALGSCKRQHRRGSSDEQAAESNRPNERVEPQSDPRFPRAGDVGPDRRGFWVEQPRESGPVSPTKLANAIAERLDGVRDHCCGDDAGRCASFDGRLLLEIGLAPDGSVDHVDIFETSIYDRRFQQCLRRRVGDWTLAGHSGDGTVRVSVPIRVRFRAPEGRDAAAR